MPPKPLPKRPLCTLSLVDLRKQAAKRRIKGRSKMSKSELCKALGYRAPGPLVQKAQQKQKRVEREQRVELCKRLQESAVQPHVVYDRNFIAKQDQSTIIQALRQVNFEKSRHFMFGAIRSSQVEFAWVTDTGLGYVFSKSMLAPLRPQSFDDYPILKCIRSAVEKYTGKMFNSVLVNRYADGSTALSYHHDDDPWLGKGFIVPSISLGAKRKFLVRQKPKYVKQGEKPITKEYILESGSLLVMGASVQKYWVHAIPQQKRSLDDRTKLTGVRYNLTFRNVHSELAGKMPKVFRLKTV